MVDLIKKSDEYCKKGDLRINHNNCSEKKGLCKWWDFTLFHDLTEKENEKIIDIFYTIKLNSYKISNDEEIYLITICIFNISETLNKDYIVLLSDLKII